MPPACVQEAFGKSPWKHMSTFSALVRQLDEMIAASPFQLKQPIPFYLQVPRVFNLKDSVINTV